MDALFWRKLWRRRAFKRIALERLTEPLHLNASALVVALFGSFRQKVAFDLIVRQPYAFGLLKAADYARRYGVDRFTAIEFGVASGAGLLNMRRVANRVQSATGIAIDVVGFDTGRGMPRPCDWRDHPDLYREGDFPMVARDRLVASLPQGTRIILGEIRETVGPFLATHPWPIGFVSIDLDYYSSTVDALKIFENHCINYLPMVLLYFDDVDYDQHSEFAGQLLAIDEFNQTHELRKISKFNFIHQKRVFTRAHWLPHMYILHVFDHPQRAQPSAQRAPIVLENPYL